MRNAQRFIACCFLMLALTTSFAADTEKLKVLEFNESLVGSGTGLFASRWGNGLLGQIGPRKVQLISSDGESICQSTVKKWKDAQWEAGDTIYFSELAKNKCRAYLKNFKLGILLNELSQYKNLPIQRHPTRGEFQKLTRQIPSEWQLIERTCVGFDYKMSSKPSFMHFEEGVPFRLLEHTLLPQSATKTNPRLSRIYIVQGSWGSTMLDAALETKLAFQLNGVNYLLFHFVGITECNYGGELIVQITPMGPKVVMFDTSGST